MILFTNYYGGFFVLTLVQNATVQLKTYINRMARLSGVTVFVIVKI